MTLTAQTPVPGFFAPPPRLGSRRVRLLRAATDLWRVIDVSGRVVGHLKTVPHPLGSRYRALRYHAASARLRGIGDFFSADDAVDALRASW